MEAKAGAPVTLLRAAHVHTVSVQGLLRDGGVAVRGGIIDDVGPWVDVSRKYPDAAVHDMGSHCLMPGLVDAHTHNLEFGPNTAYGINGEKHQDAAGALLSHALKSGVTAMGEHWLGFKTGYGFDDYSAWRDMSPQSIRIAVGSCVLGTDPLSCLCAGVDSETLDIHDITSPASLDHLVARSEFPGENLFITATVGNLRPEYVPNAGRPVVPIDAIERVVSAYHSAGKRVGAHAEGTDSALSFLRAGGDVLHHAHGLADTAFEEVAATGALICATPAGGTGAAPNSAVQILAMAAAGIPVAIATDAVLPVHPASHLYDGDDQRLVFSSDLLDLARPTLELAAARHTSMEDVLAMVTINGARILGLEDQLGSLSPGKRADLIAVADLPGEGSLVAPTIRLVMVGGEMVPLS